MVFVVVHTGGTVDCALETKRLGRESNELVVVANRLVTFVMDTVRDCDEVNMVLVGCARVILLDTAIVILEPVLTLLDMVVGLDLAITVDVDEALVPLCELAATVFSQTFDDIGGVGFAFTLTLGNICNMSTSGSLISVVIRQ